MEGIPILLEGCKLILKAPDIEYAPLVKQAIQESIDDLKIWLNWAQYIPSVEECQERATTALEAFRESRDLPFYIFTKNEQNFIGGAGLHRIDWSVPKFEMGYWIRTSCQRQGYATEAVQLLTKFAFTKLNANRVEIRCDDKNLRSKAIPQKLAFRFEGMLRNDTRTPDGQLKNTLVFAKIREDVSDA
ncbi:MAG: GCN5-related N-acetyltransferase [Firmicutes bacterium]|nr:GCN5-related N-acetyltransferase [Bacillota bacterium]